MTAWLQWTDRQLCGPGSNDWDFTKKTNSLVNSTTTVGAWKSSLCNGDIKLSFFSLSLYPPVRPSVCLWFLVVKHNSMLHLRVCAPYWVIFFLWWLSSLADHKHSRKSWKGTEYPLFMGPCAETGAFQRCYLFRHQKKTEQPLLYSICHRQNCNSCSCLTTLLLTSIRSAVICVLLSAETIHIGQIGRTGGHDVLPVPHLWEGHLNHKINDNFFYTCNRNKDPWRLVVTLPVTACGLCNALNWNDALSPFVWLDLREGCARILRINEQITQTNMHLQSQALCYFSFAALEKPAEMSLSGFKMWMLFWYSTAWRTTRCEYITHTGWLGEAVRVNLVAWYQT